MVCGHTLSFFLFTWGHNAATFGAMSKKRRVHITLPGPISDGLEALARLEGRSVSDILEELSRNELKGRGFAPKITGEEIAAEIAKTKTRKK